MIAAIGLVLLLAVAIQFLRNAPDGTTRLEPRESGRRAGGTAGNQGQALPRDGAPQAAAGRPNSASPNGRIWINRSGVDREVIESKWLEAQAQDRQWREQMQAADAHRGTNADVRQREAELHTQAAALDLALPVDIILTRFGPPHHVFRGVLENKMLRRVTLTTSEATEGTNEFSIVYSPHPSGRVQLLQGDSFQTLRLHFDREKKLRAMVWETPDQANLVGK